MSLLARLRFRHVALAFAALCGLTVALWLTFLGPGSDAPPDPTVASAQAARDALDRVPPPLRERPDTVTGGVRLVAERLPRAPEAIVAAVREAVTAGRIPPRDVLADAPGAPRPATELAPALDGREVGPAGGLELASLAAALLRARGHDAVAFGVVPGARWSATEILARRYVVRAGGGPWLALDDLPVAPSAVVALDEVALVANVLAWRALGAMVAGDESTASQAANHARRLAPDDAAVLFVVGKAQINAGLVDMGVASLERASTMAADALTWFVLARMARLSERPFRAEENLRRAIEADPAFVPPHLLRAELVLDRLEVTPRDEHPALLDSARAHVARARAIDPGAPGIRILEAHLAAVTDEPERAVALLREETELHPDQADAWLLLAQVLSVHARDAEAIAALQEADRRGLASAEILKGLGALLAAAGRFDDALPVLERAIAAAPDDPELRPQVAQLYRGMERHDDARRLLAQQVASFGDDVTSRLLLAQLELDDERWEPAFAQLAAARALAPDDAQLALLDLVAHHLAGRDATSARDRALALVGNHREVAQTLLEQGLVTPAEELLVAGLEADPDDAIAPILLVGILHGTGRAAEAAALRARTLDHFAAEDHAELERLFDAAIAQATSEGSVLAPPPGAETETGTATGEGAGTGTETGTGTGTGTGTETGTETGAGARP